MRRTESRLPLITFAACVVVAVIAFGWYAVARARIADQRYERQRDAICKVLASLPGRHPLPSIEHLRAVEARPGHPSDCYPIAHPTRTPSPTSSPGHAAPAVVLVPAPASQPAPVRPTATATASPRPTARPSPTSHPSPSPTPCSVPDVIQHPVHCLHL